MQRSGRTARSGSPTTAAASSSSTWVTCCSPATCPTPTPAVRSSAVDLDYRRGRDRLHPLRGSPAAGAQRPGVRRPRRVLVHRPRTAPRPQRPIATGLLRPRRRIRRSARCSRRSTRPTASGCRPAGDRALRGRDLHRPRLVAWQVPEPGIAVGAGLLPPHGDLLAGLPGLQLLDSLARRRRRQRLRRHPRQRRGDRHHRGRHVVAAPAPSMTRSSRTLRSGATDLRTAFVTASSTGRLLSMDWPVDGLALAHVG